eukprot:785026-Prorocentrum_lima.AAC.1
MHPQVPSLDGDMAHTTGSSLDFVQLAAEDPSPLAGKPTVRRRWPRRWGRGNPPTNFRSILTDLGL